jgi:hypothetical protein
MEYIQKLNPALVEMTFLLFQNRDAQLKPTTECSHFLTSATVLQSLEAGADQRRPIMHVASGKSNVYLYARKAGEHETKANTTQHQDLPSHIVRESRLRNAYAFAPLPIDPSPVCRITVSRPKRRRVQLAFLPSAYISPPAP